MTRTTEARISEIDATILASARGDVLMKIIEATEGDLEIRLSPGGEHPTQGRVLDERELYQVLVSMPRDLQEQFLMLDARENIPEMLSVGLKGLAQWLLHLAEVIEAIPCEPYVHFPKAYAVNDAKTGEGLRKTLNAFEANAVALGYGEMTGESVVLSVDSPEVIPELLEEAETLLDTRQRLYFGNGQGESNEHPTD
jgi:hypothetical protein